MQSEFKANQALADYNEKEYAMRMEWKRVLGDKRQGRRKLAAPVKPKQAKPVTKQGFFSRFFFKVA